MSSRSPLVSPPEPPSMVPATLTFTLKVSSSSPPLAVPVRLALNVNVSAPPAPARLLKFVKSAVAPPVTVPSFSVATVKTSSPDVPCNVSLVLSPVKSSMFAKPAALPLLSADALRFPRSTSCAVVCAERFSRSPLVSVVEPPSIGPATSTLTLKVSSPSPPLALPVRLALNVKTSAPPTPSRMLKSLKSTVAPPVIIPSFSVATVNVSALEVPRSVSFVPSPVKSSKFEKPAAPPPLTAETLLSPRLSNCDVACPERFSRSPLVSPPEPPSIVPPTSKLTLKMSSPAAPVSVAAVVALTLNVSLSPADATVAPEPLVKVPPRSAVAPVPESASPESRLTLIVVLALSTDPAAIEKSSPALIVMLPPLDCTVTLPAMSTSSPAPAVSVAVTAMLPVDVMPASIATAPAAVRVVVPVTFSRPLTVIGPPTIVTLSVNVELPTSIAPVPFAASPIVMAVKPSDRKASSASSRFRVPAPPPRPIVVVATSGSKISSPWPSMTVVPLSTTSSPIRVIVPNPEASPISVFPKVSASPLVADPVIVTVATPVLSIVPPVVNRPESLAPIPTAVMSMAPVIDAIVVPASLKIIPALALPGLPVPMMVIVAAPTASLEVMSASPDRNTP